jgi:hypothetical protein
MERDAWRSSDEANHCKKKVNNDGMTPLLEKQSNQSSSSEQSRPSTTTTIAPNQAQVKLPSRPCHQRQKIQQ